MTVKSLEQHNAHFPTLGMANTSAVGQRIAAKFGWQEVPVKQRTGSELWRQYATPFGQLSDMAIANHFLKMAHAFNTGDIEQVNATIDASYNETKPVTVAPAIVPTLKSRGASEARQLGEALCAAVGLRGGTNGGRVYAGYDSPFNDKTARGVWRTIERLAVMAQVDDQETIEEYLGKKQLTDTI